MNHSYLKLKIGIIALALGLTLWGKASHAQGMSIQSFMPTAKKTSAFATWWLERLHTLDIDAQVRDMKEKGESTRVYYGVSVEGALLYENTLNATSRSTFAPSGRDTGMELLPFRLSILQDGSAEIRTSAFAFRNMNQHARFYGGYDWGSTPGRVTGWSFVNNISFATFSWSQNYRFKDMTEWSIDLAEIEPRLAFNFGKKESDNYIAITATGRIGWKQTNIDNVNGERVTFGGVSFDYDANTSTGTPHKMTFYEGYSGGLLLNLENRHGSRLQATGVWTSGSQNGYLHDQSITAANAVNQAAFDAANSVYQQEMDGFNQSKEEFVKSHALSTPEVVNWTDAQFAVATGTQIPTAPKAADHYDENVNAVRNWGYLSAGLEVSQKINRKTGKTPRTISIGGKYNIPVYDDLSGGTLHFDLKERFQAPFEIHLRFKW